MKGGMMELIIDGVVGRWLGYEECADVFRRAIEMAKMTPLGHFRYEETKVGISAWQMLMESHLVMDYFHNAVCITLFSCKDFKADKVGKFLLDKFQIIEIHNYEIRERGFAFTEKWEYET